MDVLALSSSTVDHLPRYAAVVVAVLGVWALKRAPRLALVAWLVGVCFVPVWVGITIKVDLEPHVLASVGLLVCLLPVAVRGRGTTLGRFTLADALFLGVLAAALVPVLLGKTTFSDLFVLLVQWTAAFLAGRLVSTRVPLPWVYGAIAVAFTVVAALALVEFSTGVNPFVHIPGDGALRQVWASIQLRGGRPRAEAAFGHSIALGACLAMAVPITLAAPFRVGVRIAMVVLELAATVVTFSRIGLVTAVLGAVLAVLFLHTELPRRLRVAATAGLVAVAVGFSSLVASVFSAAGDEASNSADYRLELLKLLPDLVPFGYSSSSYRQATGQLVLANVPSADGTLHSVDNALLVLGLTYGWVPMVLVLAVLLLGLGALLRGRATAPTIAVLAQIPAFATVALITQYSTVTWFVAGLAVCAQSAARRAAPRPEPQKSPEMVTGVVREAIPTLS